MKLLQTILSQIPPLYANEELSASAVKVIAKIFIPLLDYAWYVTESDGEDICFGFVNLADDEMAELGYFSIKELEELQISYGIVLELDTSWDSDICLEDVLKFWVR